MSSPIDWSCPYQDEDGLWNCGAEKGEKCSAVLFNGRRVDLYWFHPERQDAALAMDGKSNVTDSQLDEAASKEAGEIA